MERTNVNMADNVTKGATKEVPAAEPVRRVGPIQFFQEVRRETSKVTWPTWKETWLTSVMVFIMVLLTMVFFFVVDSVLGWGVTKLLGMGS
jgi:preprotein translocase subunit SecE